MSAELIKARLLDLLVSSAQGNGSFIVSELAFVGGRSKADLVEISSCLSAFEIKSEKDSFDRLRTQLSLYSRTFDYVTLVLDQKHYGRLPTYVSKKVGILAFCKETDSLTWMRQPSRFIRPHKFYLSMFLWRADIEKALASAGAPFRSEETVHSLRMRFTQLFGQEEIHQLAIDAIRKHYFSRFENFMRERGQVTHPEDVALLSAYDHEVSD